MKEKRKITPKVPGQKGQLILEHQQMPDITTSKPNFLLQDTIVATIHNDLLLPIAAMDHQSACTIATLQRLDQNNEWKAQLPCRMGIRTRLVVIPAGTSVVLQLSPGAGSFQQQAQWESGTYRIHLQYFAGVTDINALSGTGSTSLYSPTFTIE